MTPLFLVSSACVRLLRPEPRPVLSPIPRVPFQRSRHDADGHDLLWIRLTETPSL
jgi:hypothetical protein